MDIKTIFTDNDLNSLTAWFVLIFIPVSIINVLVLQLGTLPVYIPIIAQTFQLPRFLTFNYKLALTI